jgi:ABC-type branched-subunit amino acid transport system ATPase component
MLETRGITKAFGGVHAVDGLSIAVEPACVTALVGPNGSGKTTLINVLTGMLPIDGGSVVVAGRDSFSRIKPYRVASFGITRTFQEVRLFEQMPVIDNVLVVLTTRSVLGSFRSRPARRHVETAERLLREVGLWEKRDQLASSLSYGQRKLLEIARAMAMDAEIYFFDEPFAGLFPEMVKVIVDIVGSLRERGKTVVLVEHDMGVIRQLADHVIVMDEGKLLAEGAPEDVLTRREVVEAYLGA